LSCQRRPRAGTRARAAIARAARFMAAAALAGALGMTGGCGAHSSAGAPAGGAGPASLSAEGAGPDTVTIVENEVYGALLTELYANSDGRMPTGTFVMAPPERPLVAIFDSMLIASDSVDPHTRAEYLARNARAFELAPTVPGLPDQVVLTEAEVDAIFIAGRWQGFYERYPDAVGLIRLSRVGFSQDGGSALLFVARHTSGLAGELGFVGMRRTADGWRFAGWALRAISAP